MLVLPNTFAECLFGKLELYYSDNYNIKYLVETPNNKHILDNCYGIHLWNHLTHDKYNIDFGKIHPNSLYQILYNIVYS